MQDYRHRRARLLELIKTHYPDTTDGSVLLMSGYEHEYGLFRPDSSFYYYTGLEEPGYMLLLDLSGRTQLFAPTFKTSRQAWMVEQVPHGFDSVIPLGDPVAGYQAHLYSEKSSYTSLAAALARVPVLYALSSPLYTQVMVYLAKLGIMLDGRVLDIAAIIGRQRSVKDPREIQAIRHAVDITMEAHVAAASVIDAGTYEREVKAGIEYLFTDAGADCAFTSIVAAGKNSTVLHYNKACEQIRQNDLVVVDIGARKQGYCADLTRTYPAAGVFTSRQRQVYDLVLSTQDFIARRARPGVFLRNAEKPEQSLHHLAVQFLEQRGYAQYFNHGIGHHLGIDVHDLSDAHAPLEEGAVFTIEPGIYIPQEKLGIRIEDNYLITKSGAECLSQELPKTAREIEQLMAGELTPDEGDDTFEE